MRIIDSYPKVFNQVVPQTCISGNPCQWDINEFNSSAKMKQLRIFFSKCDYLCFDEKVVKGMGSMFSGRTSNLEDDDCDGIGIFQNGDWVRMYFVDLKSGFDIDKIQHGFVQSLNSFFKMHAMMSLCEGYHISGTKLEFIVACKCFQDNEKETKTCDWMLRKRTADPESFAAKVAYPLYRNGSMNIKIKDFPEVAILPFSNEIRDCVVKLTLVRTANYLDEYAIYNI